MSQNITCREAQQHLQQIKSLERELQEIVVSAQAEKITEKERKELSKEARRVKLTLEAEIISLQEQANPFERLFNLKEQYQSQIKVLEIAQILETKEIKGEKVKGITDIEGNFQPLPTLKEVIGRLREKKELLERKQTQGFGKIRLVPFGMSLEDLVEKHKQVLIEKAQAEKLFTSRKNRNDPNEARVPLELDLDDPMFMAAEYKNADKKGTLVYHVTSLTQENHGGCTKREILKQRRESTYRQAGNIKSGWDIVVLENNINIPRKEKGKTINGRKQIETNRSSEQYLQLLQTPQYRGETGLTPEETLMHAITELVENNEVIDEYQGNGSICYNIGAYFPMNGALESWLASGLVPFSYFYRDSRQAYLRRVCSYERRCQLRAAFRGEGLIFITLVFTFTFTFVLFNPRGLIAPRGGNHNRDIILLNQVKF